MKPLLHSTLLTIAAAIVTTNGCLEFDFELLTFANPTIAPSEAEVQAELFGSYLVVENSDPKPEAPSDLDFPGDENDSASYPSVTHIGRAGKGFPKGFLRWATVELSSRGELSVDDSGQPCFASKVGENFVLNLPWEKAVDEIEDAKLEKDQLGKAEVSEKTQVIQLGSKSYEGYLLVLLKPTPSGFTVHQFDEEFLKSEITAGRLAGKYMTEEQKKVFKKNREIAKKLNKVTNDKWIQPSVDASTDELNAFLKRNEKKIVGEPLMILKRIN